MRILLVEDEQDLAEPLCAALRHEHHQVTWVNSLAAAYAVLEEKDIDLAVVDVMLPESEEGGLELVKALRSTAFIGGVLLLTTRTSVSDLVYGLDLGADDYLIKPFNLREFLARVRALLRRPAQTRSAHFSRGALVVDLAQRRVTWQGREVILSPQEFNLLELLALYPERTFAAEELADHLLANAQTLSGVWVYVHRLRQKLHPSVISTTAGGYKLGSAEALT